MTTSQHLSSCFLTFCFLDTIYGIESELRSPPESFFLALSASPRFVIIWLKEFLTLKFMILSWSIIFTSFPRFKWTDIEWQFSEDIEQWTIKDVFVSGAGQQRKSLSKLMLKCAIWYSKQLKYWHHCLSWSLSLGRRPLDLDRGSKSAQSVQFPQVHSNEHLSGGFVKTTSRLWSLTKNPTFLYFICNLNLDTEE